jgi:hypothetical protein
LGPIVESLPQTSLPEENNSTNSSSNNDALLYIHPILEDPVITLSRKTSVTTVSNLAQSNSVDPNFESDHEEVNTPIQLTEDYEK